MKADVRSDIQGLRAISVIVVIGSHLFGWPSGGFIGVDIFFVISGFLITGLLLREHGRTGRISLAGFYRRRIRRILPISTLVLLTVTVASFVIFRAVRADAIRTDALWSLIFASNWHFAAVGTDYFNQTAAVSPLQHFWSLAVEEQFYLVWPLLMIILLAVFGNRKHSPRIVLGAVLFAVMAASLSFCIWETSTNPTWAYFSTFARGWELGAGALLAVSSPLLSRIRRRLRPLLSWLGIAGVIVGLVVITPSSSFPGALAVLPVAAAALIITAGIGEQYHAPWVLTNPVSSYLGNISYSLYLWHFPVIVLLGALTHSLDTIYYLEAIALMAAVSMFSYHFIEDPIRRSRWLEHGPRVKPGNRAAVIRAAGRERALASLGICAALVAATVLVTLQQDRTATANAQDIVQPLTFPGSTAPSAAAKGVPVSAAQAALSAQITTSLAATTWPTNMSPALSELNSKDGATEWVEDGCLGGNADAETTTQHCLYGDPKATKTAVLIGDSVAISYLPGIRAALVPAGWKIRVLTYMLCPWESVTVNLSAGLLNAPCDGFRAWAMSQVAILHPDLVIMSSAQNTYGRTVGSSATAMSRWQQGAKTTLSNLTGKAARVVVLAPPPQMASLQTCATKFSVPSDCAGTVADAYDVSGNAVESVVETTAAEKNLAVTYVKTEPWFCDTARSCPSFVGSTPVFVDGEHLTDAYSTHLAPLLSAALLGSTAVARATA